MIKFATAQVQGNVGNVDIKTLEGDRKVANISIASEESYKAKGSDEYTNITTWVRCVTFNPGTVDYIERNVQKGRQVMVAGRLRENSWEKDGQKHSTLELHIDNIQVGAKVDGDDNE